MACYETCGRQYYYRYILGGKSTVSSCNLGFGSAVATGMEMFLRGVAAGVEVDPVAVFDHHWNTFADANHVVYPAHWDRKVAHEVGSELMRQFPEEWDRSGYTVAVDAQGTAMIERKFKAEIAPGIILSTKLDVGVLDPEGKFYLLDGKTTRTAAVVEFLLLAEQLTAYQAVHEAHQPTTGLPNVEGVAFWEFIKRKPARRAGDTGPEILRPDVVKRRSTAQVQEYLDKAVETVQDIRSGRFRRMPRMAYNSPCQMCDFRKGCAFGDFSDIKFESQESRAIALKLAA